MLPKHRATTKAMICWAALLLLLSSASARADGQQQWKARLAAHCAKFNLPIKEVPLGADVRPGLCRLVFPVLPHTAQALEQDFNIGNGAMIWVARQDKVHITLNLGPGDYMGYGYGNHGNGNVNGYFASRFKQANPNMPANGNPGQYLILGLNPGAAKGVQDFWSTDGTADNIYRANHSATDWDNANRAGCMWWVVAAEMAKGKSLWNHYYGVARSRHPDTLLKKLIHCGNECVGPLGISVKTVEEFNAIPLDKLLGDPPGGALADHVR